MLVVNGEVEDIRLEDDTCIALGTFDGLHLGHQALINECVKSANKKGLKSVVLTFDAPPLSVLVPGDFSGIIMDNASKIRMIEKMGVDYLIFIHFTKEFAANEPESFLNFLEEKLHAKELICGYNYSFGRYGSGKKEMLQAYKDTYGYELKVFEPVRYDDSVVSSTIIRERLINGKVEEASRLLGYRYFLEGKVSEGEKVGTTLGFPTANLYIQDNLVVKNGVYITNTYVNNKIYDSITNIGYAPTFNNRARAAEIFILNYSSNLYGGIIKTEFLEFLRPEKKYSSSSQLKQQILKDIEGAKEYFKKKNK